MILRPGSVLKSDIPTYLNKVSIILKTGWTEDEYYGASLRTLAEINTYLAGEAHAAEQQKRKDEIAAKRNRR
jgi:hypothetical protein